MNDLKPILEILPYTAMLILLSISCVILVKRAFKKKINTSVITDNHRKFFNLK